MELKLEGDFAGIAWTGSEAGQDGGWAADDGPTPTGESPRGLEAPSAEIALLDLDGMVVAVNAAWRASVEALGVNLRCWGVGFSYLDVARRFIPDLDDAGLRHSLESLRNGRVGRVQHAYAIQTVNGPQWRQVQITTLSLGVGVRYVAIHENLTELVLAQKALRRTSAQLLTAQDDERHRIAIELHDSTCQHLAVLGLGLGRLRRLTKNASSLAVLDEMAGSLREAVLETRVLSYLMKPTGLLQRGLVATAGDFVAGFARRTGLRARFETEGDVDTVPAPVQHATFRILQEALSNVFRHAQARNIEASVLHTPVELTLRIVDDGQGFRPFADEAGAMGVGISGMRARVEQLDGRLEIASGATGTRVEAVFPLLPSVEASADPGVSIN